VEHREKNHFSQGGMLKSTYKGRFLTQKNHIRNYWIENPNSEHMVICLMEREELKNKIKTKFLNFSPYSKSTDLNIFILEMGCKKDWIR
jgi:hypothetical protein